MSFLGSLFGGGKSSAAPAAYVPPTPVVQTATPATTADTSNITSGNATRQAALAAAGLNSTVKNTGGPAAVGTKSLLGQ